MIDLHAHVLPGIDDGPRTEDDAVELARAAADSGVSVIAATPHLRADHLGVVPSELAARCDRLQARLDDEGIPVDLVPAGELDLHWAQAVDDDELRLVSYGQMGTWLLVETPYGALSELFEELLFKLTARGFRTVLAHPERNPSLQQRPERIRALVERGALVQVTAQALAAAQPRDPARRLAEALVRESLAHVLASDAHRATGHRGAGLYDGAQAADRLVPGAGAYLTRRAPEAILAGATPGPAPRAGGLRRRLGRRGS